MKSATIKRCVVHPMFARLAGTVIAFKGSTPIFYGDAPLNPVFLSWLNAVKGYPVEPPRFSPPRNFFNITATQIFLK